MGRPTRSPSSSNSTERAPGRAGVRPAGGKHRRKDRAPLRTSPDLTSEVSRTVMGGRRGATMAEATAKGRDDDAVSLVPDPGVILHVEDEEATRFVVRRVLESAGFKVRSAGSSADAAPLLEGADVAVLDMNLPDGTGIDLCRAIKGGPREQRLPVLILSATSIAPQDRARGLEMGADAYLTHPVEPMVLVAT